MASGTEEDEFGLGEATLTRKQSREEAMDVEVGVPPNDLLQV